MPQRKLVEPTSLRRSPRLLNLSKLSPITPELTNPKKCSSINSTKCDNWTKNFRKSVNGSSNSGKSSYLLKRLDNGSKNLKKSENGCRKKTKLSDCPRRSSRFCDEVNSSVELNCSNNSKKELNLLRNNDFVDCPVTPIIGVREKKSMLVNDIDTSDSCGGNLVNFDRRITRSCSRLAKAKEKEKVEVEKVAGKTVKGRSLFVDDTDTSDSCGGVLVNFDKRVTRSCSRLAKARGEVGEVAGKTVKGRSLFVDDTDTSDLCGGVLVNVDKRVTRSCSRLTKAKGEVEKVAEKRVKGRRLFEGKAGGSKGREVQRLVKVSKGKEKRGRVEVGKIEENKSCELKGRKVQGSVKLVSCNKGKEKRGSDCKGVKGGSGRMRPDNVSHSVARGGRQGRQNTLRDCDEKVKKTGESCKEVAEVLEGRITRNASKQVGRQIEPHCQIMERRITRSASKQVVRKAEKYTRDIDVKRKETRDCVDVDIGKLEIERIDPSPLCKLPGKVERNKQDFTVDTKLTGVKRKRKQAGIQEGKNKGWTKEQELELHKAYFTAKPSPHFWKRVAKLVPGKSAQECFDKVHSDNQTPVCSKPSLRAKKKSPLSGIELFDSAKKKSKKANKVKHKNHVGRKTVRHLLQKYCHLNQDSGTDLFSILEPSVKPSVVGFNLTPEHLMRSPESSSKSRGRYASGHKKCLSRLSDESESLLTSPPVLKKVKNMVLHEKYIDQLHTREHKRKLSFSRCMKSSQNQKVGEKNSIPLKDIIKTAKEALVSEAKDVIDNYRHSQANIMEELSDSEELLNSDDEDDETLV